MPLGFVLIFSNSESLISVHVFFTKRLRTKKGIFCNSVKMKIVVNYCGIISWNLLNYLTGISSTKKCCVTYYCHMNYRKILAVIHAHFCFSCSHEITEDSNANQTSQIDLEKENFNEKDNDEETMLVSTA